ncbi:MAG TPA: hypothetical protein VFZ53_31360 [Polyangiaceae bacterium]
MTEKKRARAIGALALGLATLSQGCETFHYCEPSPAKRIERAPARLSTTGLFSDIRTRTLAPGVRPFRPTFELWSDGASKQRWIALPAGEVIDTRAMNDWWFPVGTKLWKEFRSEGKPVETRLLEKLGPGEHDWLTLSYLWNEDESDASVVPEGAVNARGTELDVPAAGECAACHGGRRSFVLGFSALQLAGDAAGADGTGLAELEAEGLLSHPRGETYAVPGDATEREALGYLHANCGHCHNQNRPPAGDSPCFDPKSDLDLWLDVHRLASLEQTPAYRTARGEAVEPGNPDDSRLIELVSTRGMFRQMPPLATERVDHRGVRLLSDWIRGLEAR